MIQAILHIPHSSPIIPFYDGYVFNQVELEKEMRILTDWFTDDLFESSGDIAVKTEFSRVFCDVERFEHDADEIMAKLGMGAIYTHSETGRLMRKLKSGTRKKILHEYYKPHHKRLYDAVQSQLDLNGLALIVDCYSFPDKPLARDINKRLPRPDFNIGTDAFHTPGKLIEIAADFFKTKGFPLGIDCPYRGTIVQMEYYRKNEKVYSIMLEVNRKLYLKENTTEKSNNYPVIKNVLKEFVNVVKNQL